MKLYKVLLFVLLALTFAFEAGAMNGYGPAEKDRKYARRTSPLERGGGSVVSTTEAVREWDSELAEAYTHPHLFTLQSVAEISFMHALFDALSREASECLMAIANNRFDRKKWLMGKVLSSATPYEMVSSLHHDQGLYFYVEDPSDEKAGTLMINYSPARSAMVKACMEKLRGKRGIAALNVVFTCSIYEKYTKVRVPAKAWGNNENKELKRLQDEDREKFRRVAISTQLAFASYAKRMLKGQLESARARELKAGAAAAATGLSVPSTLLGINSATGAKSDAGSGSGSGSGAGLSGVASAKSDAGAGSGAAAAGAGTGVASMDADE